MLQFFLGHPVDREIKMILMMSFENSFICVKRGFAYDKNVYNLLTFLVAKLFTFTYFYDPISQSQYEI